MIELRPGHSPPHVTMAAFTALGSHQMSSVALARTQPSASALLRVAACACVCRGAVQMPCRCRACMRVLLCMGPLHGRLGVVAQNGSLDNLVRVEEVHAGKHLRHWILHSLLRATRPGRPHRVRVGVSLPPGRVEWEVDILRALFEALGLAYAVLRMGGRAWALREEPGIRHSHRW